jgi:non-ribosomal peptide synthetase component F
LIGRLQAVKNAQATLGLFINTLPIRLNIDATSVRDSLLNTHRSLSALLDHEHASLALAQRCSALPASTPLFSALLNYRHNTAIEDVDIRLPNLQVIQPEERTNYPIVLSVEDGADSLGLTAQSIASIAPERLCNLMEAALMALCTALEQDPAKAIAQLDILPPDERALTLEAFNQTTADYDLGQTVMDLIEARAARSPNALALSAEDAHLSYAQLDAAANRLAHHLREQGIKPDDRVALCLQRSLSMVVSMLAVLTSE